MGNRYCGLTDIELTDFGVSQAKDINGLIRDVQFDGVFSSPLQRAFKTAEIASGRPDVQKEQRLIEVDFGQWEGLRREEFVAKDPGSWLDWDSDPGRYPAGRTGETATQVIERVDEFFMETEMEPKRLQESLGHNLSEVIAGMVLGIVIAFFMLQFD